LLSLAIEELNANIINLTRALSARGWHSPSPVAYTPRAAASDAASRVVVDAPVTLGVDGTQLPLPPRQPPKSVRYANEFKKKLVKNNSHYTAHFSQASRDVVGFTVTRIADSDILFQCERNHRALKNAFFAFGLNRYIMDDFVSCIAANGGTVPNLGGDLLSPEYASISYYQESS
jgi:hypothetical protein